MTLDRDIALAAALEHAQFNWRIFPLRGKEPFASAHRGGSRGQEHRECAGRCGHPGHGVLSATTDLAVIEAWWRGRYAGCNIGGRIPDPMFMLDTDPRHGGLESLAELEFRYGPLPETLTDYSGRCDGGAHYFFRRPPGKLSARRLGPGIDLKTSTGYTVLPPSIHPDTGWPYTRVEHQVATPPGWLIALLLPEPPKTAPPKPRPVSRFFYGSSPADEYNVNTSWAAILEPHGWRCVDPDPDADGARWLHPTATSACSATVRNGCLFVWSTSTVFDISEPGYPKGYTKFRAYALLNHDGDMGAAARALRRGVA